MNHWILVIGLLAAIPSLVSGQVRCEVEKLAGSNPDASGGALGGYLAYPAGLPGVAIKDNLTLPGSGTWFVWLRHLNNGSRSITVTVNGTATPLLNPTPNGNWIWSLIRAINGSAACVQIESTGALPGILDSLIFAPNSQYNPNIQTFGDWGSYPEILPPVGFAQGLIDQNPNITTTDWINQVGEHYSYPAVSPATVVDNYGNILWNDQPWFHLSMFHSSVTDPVLRPIPELNNYLGWADVSWPDNVTSVSSFWQLTTKYDYLAANFSPLAARTNLFYHYICDEPDEGWISAVALQRLNALMKRMDPTKPTYINVSNSSATNPDFLTIPDIVGVDYYPVPTSKWGQRISGVGQGIDSVRYFSNLRPTIFTGQSWTWGTAYPYPTPQELRAMTWSALAHNVRGLWFYQWPVDGQPGHTVATDQPALWSDMKTVFTQIASIRSVLQGPEVARPYTTTVMEPAGAASAEFRVAVNATRTQAYLIAVCPRQSDENWPCRVRLNFAAGPLADIQLSPIFSNQTASVNCVGTGVWDITFSSALGSGVFTIVSAHINDLTPMTHDQAKAMLKKDLGLTALRLEGEDFSEVTTSSSPEYMAGKMVYVGNATTSANYNLPAPAVNWDLATGWNVWVRIWDNGLRPLEITINGTSSQLTSTSGSWTWMKLNQAIYATTSITVGMRATGSLPAMVDGIICTNDPAFDPVALTVNQLNELPRMTFTVGPPVSAQVFGDSHTVTLTAASPTFTADLSNYTRFTDNLFAIVGNDNTFGCVDLMWMNTMYESLGPGVVVFGSQAGWPYGFAVYKFSVVDTTTLGGTVSVRVRYLGTPSMFGQGYYLGIGSSFTPSGNLQHFNYSDFVKATCAGSEGFGAHYRLLTVPIPPGLSTFYVVLGKAFGSYDTLGAEALQIDAVLSPAIRGTVVLDGYAPVDPTVPVAVKAELRDPATQALVASASSILDSQGRFTFSDAVAPGTYAMSVQGCGWLKKTVTVTVAAGFNDLPAVHLSGGDLDGSNEVTSADLALLLTKLK